MKYQVFISHSHIDAAFAEEVTTVLEERGIQCWIAPRDVPAGGSYAAAILTALERSSCVVLIYTDNCNTSGHVLREVERAVCIGAHVIPLRFDTSVVSKSLSYFLTSVRWLSVLSRPPARDIELAADSIAKSFVTETPPIESATDSITPPNPSSRLAKKDRPRAISARRRNLAISAAMAVLGVLLAILLLDKTRNDRGTPPSPTAIVIPAPKTEAFRQDTPPPGAVPKEQVISPARDHRAVTSAQATPAPSLPGERYPETRTRVLSPAELQSWSVEKLRYAINEIFARNDASFPDKKIQNWFSQFTWYRARTNLTFDEIESSLPEIERQNVKILADARQAKAISGGTIAAVWRGIIQETVVGGGGFQMPCEFTFDETLKEVSSLINVDKHRGGSTHPYTKKGNSFCFSWPVPDDFATVTNLVFTPAGDGKTASVTSECLVRGKRISTGFGTFSKVE